MLLAMLAVGCEKNGDDITVVEKFVNPYQSAISRVKLQTPKTIDSRTEWVENVQMITSGQGSSKSYLVRCRGRGNSTWWWSKKWPYLVKLYERESVLGFPKARSWVLMANALDPTMLRNEVSFFMSENFSTLEYTPHLAYVDLYINDDYRGLYQFGEKPRISKSRVNVGDDGFLLEVDGKANEGEITFSVTGMNPINIKDPDVTVGDTNYVYIRDFITELNDIMLSRDAAKERKYLGYIDLYSFADYYLINEIAKNVDGNYYTSCYMNLKRGGLLKMGPVWDFDTMYGNYFFGDAEINGFINATSGYLMGMHWLDVLFQDPDFKTILKEKFQYYYDHRQEIYDFIDEKSTLIKEAIADDNAIWGQLCDRNAPAELVITTYQEKVDSLKQWIEDRFKWLADNLPSRLQ